MPAFTAKDVQSLRQATGAGMMDAKKALEETDGDFDQAIEVLRVKYAAKVDKKAAERTAGNGLVAAAEGALVELKCETDFVAKSDDFVQLARSLKKVGAAKQTSAPAPKARSADPLAGGSRAPSNAEPTVLF